MDPQQYTLIEEYSRDQMEKLGVYAWPHIQRVLQLSLIIAQGEGEVADLEVVRSAAMLHDIAISLERPDQGVEHGAVGAEMAQNFLLSIGVDEQIVRHISEVIRNHTRRQDPLSIEAQILCDADFLDKLGAVGIATVFVKACLTDTTIEDVAAIYEQNEPKRSYVGTHLGWIKNPRLYTQTAWKMAQERNRIIAPFFKALQREIEVASS